MKRYYYFYLLAILFFLSQLKCHIFDSTYIPPSTVLPVGPQISVNYTHTKFKKTCNNGVCVYTLTVPGMSNEITSYIKSRIDSDKKIEATEETITQNLSNQLNNSLQNLENTVEKLGNELNNLTSKYTDLLNQIETIEIDLEKTDDSLLSIQAYVNEMNETSSDNPIYQCYVNAYESCSESSATTLPSLLTTTQSPVTSNSFSPLLPLSTMPSSVTGTSKVSGVTGVTGTAGPTGATGITGAAGPTGATGITGAAGSTGASSTTTLSTTTTTFNGT